MSVYHYLSPFEARRRAVAYEPLSRIEISGRALRYNTRWFVSKTGRMVIPVLKSNAYGCGIEQAAMALDDTLHIPYFAVDSYHEALRVRAVSTRPVLIMSPIHPRNYSAMVYDNFAFVVSTAEAIEGLGRTGRPIRLHLECNTGMNRYGADVYYVGSLIRLIHQYKNLQLEGVMGHLADSESDGYTTLAEATERFDAFVDEVREAGGTPTLFHLAQSAGCLRVRSRYATAVRIGMGTYGLNPFDYGHLFYDQCSGLHPALRLISTVTHVRTLRMGEHVGYGYTFTAPRQMRIGVLPIGYHGGVDPLLGNGALVKIGDSYVPVVGAVCMNATMVSLEGTNAHEGDEVVIYSSDRKDKNSFNSLARYHGVGNHMLMVRLNPDLERILVD